MIVSFALMVLFSFFNKRLSQNQITLWQACIRYGQPLHELRPRSSDDADEYTLVTIMKRKVKWGLGAI